jgi:hypothetical protein
VRNDDKLKMKNVLEHEETAKFCIMKCFCKSPTATAATKNYLFAFGMRANAQQ